MKRIEFEKLFALKSSVVYGKGGVNAREFLRDWNFQVKNNTLEKIPPRVRCVSVDV